MPSDYLVQAILGHDSALPEDVSVNTWNVFTVATGDEAALNGAITAIEAFYETIDTQLSSLLSGSLIFKAYDRAEPSPRVPVLQRNESITPGTTAMPGEVALCVSFQAAPESGLNQARRRGRIYLGPLSAVTLNTATGRPETATLTAIQAAADTLVTASKAASAWSLSVWSGVNGSSSTIDNGWIDNDWDTQRRRGQRATGRHAFS